MFWVVFLLQDLFTFSNAIIHDVAYDLLLFRHKVELHQLTAAWYERHWDTARESTAKLIAKHWIKGEKPAKVRPLAQKGGVNGGD